MPIFPESWIRKVCSSFIYYYFTFRMFGISFVISPTIVTLFSVPPIGHSRYISPTSKGQRVHLLMDFLNVDCEHDTDMISISISTISKSGVYTHCEVRYLLSVICEVSVICYLFSVQICSVISWLWKLGSYVLYYSYIAKWDFVNKYW